MGQKVSQFILYSKDKEHIAQFLGDLFDMEQVRLKEGVKLHSPFLNFLVVGLAPNDTRQSDTMVDIEFDSDDELSDFWHKVQFFKYRYKLIDHEEEKITQVNSLRYFILKDPDARKWMFSYRPIVS